jgi:hypothetical protein
MIAEGVIAYWDSDHSNATTGESLTHCVPTTMGPSPDADPGAEKHPVNDTNFTAHFDAANGTWPAIGWKPLKPFLYRYTWTQSLATCPAPAAAAEATAGISAASGDLDGDNTNSTFMRYLNVMGGDMSIDNLLKTAELE